MCLLKNYFVGVTPKTKLIIYLIATGKYNFSQIGKMSPVELSKWRPKIQKKYPDLVDIVDELCAQKNNDERVFTVTSGRPYSIKNITDMLTRVHKIAGEKYEGKEAFVQRINKKHEKSHEE